MRQRVVRRREREVRWTDGGLRQLEADREILVAESEMSAPRIALQTRPGHDHLAEALVPCVHVYPVDLPLPARTMPVSVPHTEKTVTRRQDFEPESHEARCQFGGHRRRVD